MIQNKFLNTIYKEILASENKGAIASYIPELAKVEESKFGVCLSDLNQNTIGLGDFDQKFSIQSIAKVLSCSLAYQLEGEKLWERVGVEPSGSPFNSLVQLENNKGIPRNPFINAGAIVICDVLLSRLSNPKKDLLKFISEISELPNLEYSTTISESERQTGFRNIALCNYIKALGNINNSPEKVLDLYFNLCSIEMSCKEVTKSFLFLANKGIIPWNQKTILSTSQTKRMNALMLTCGFYDESGEFAFNVGLPGKSGVGGGIIALLPEEYAICVWSPKLNKKGNSYRGMRFLEQFTTMTNTSIF
jgi:glutaminase